MYVSWNFRSLAIDDSVPVPRYDVEISKLGKDPVRRRCNNCRMTQFTRVDSGVSANGKVWATLCCIFLSWILSLLVLCMDGFREYRHYCPSCNVLLGTYAPKFSAGQIILLVLLTCVFITLAIFVIYVKISMH